MDFTYENYRATCLNYQKSGYKFLDLGKKIEGKSIYMVHDCDSFLENAENLARVESEIGVKSTYFIRMGARAYNILSPYYSNIVSRISNLGHDIGLHYENIFDEDSIQYSIDLLSKAIKKDVKYFNVHEPVRTGLDFALNTSPKNRCWNAPFFEQVKYISDSGGRWREGCFSQHVDKHRKLLVSTHPVWWFRSAPTRNY